MNSTTPMYEQWIDGKVEHVRDEKNKVSAKEFTQSMLCCLHD